MAIGTYTDLKAAIASWINRSDLTAVMDDFIDLTEAKMNRKLRLRSMETATTLTIDSNGDLAVPSDMLELISMALVNGDTTRNLRISPKGFIEAETRTGVPERFARIDGNWNFSPKPDAQYTVNVIYYAKPTALSTSNETNAFTTDVPDALLAGCLYEAYMYLKDLETALIWRNKFKEAIADAQNDQMMTEWSGSQVTGAG